MRILLALIVVSLAGCATTHRASALHQYPLQLGKPLPPHANSSPLAWVHRGGTRCAHQVELEGIQFDVDLDCETHMVTSFSTRDRKFRTPEGLSVGSTRAQALHAGGAPLDENSCNVLLPSGWVAIMDSCIDDAKITDFEPRYEEEDEASLTE